MITKRELKRFLKAQIEPDFDSFFLYKDEMLVKVSSIFVHGVYFQRSRVGNDIYVQPFIDFLTDAKDFTGFTIGLRVRRIDMPAHYRDFFELEPPETAAELIVKSIRAGEYYPFVVHPTCRSLLDAFATRLDAVWALFGLGCCAIMEGDRDMAADLLRKFDNIKTKFDDEDSKRDHQLYLSIAERLDNLDLCRKFLWQKCEETIRLRKLERIAELSGWKAGR